MREDHPLHYDPRCHECGERLAEADRAEVFLTGRSESAWTYGPFLVHADPCFRTESGGRPKYSLA